MTYGVAPVWAVTVIEGFSKKISGNVLKILTDL